MTISNSVSRLTFRTLQSPKCRPPTSKFIIENRPFSTCSILFRFDPDAFDSYGGDQREQRPNSQYEFKENSKKQNWSEIDLTEIKRNVFLTNPEGVQISDEEVAKFRKDNRISIEKSSGEVPNPVFDLDELSIPEKLKETLKRSGIEKPMPIQAQGWSIAMSGTDLIGVGETGSGKTLGFLLPAFQHILQQEKTRFQKGPQVLVLSPTRELAQQTQAVSQKFGSTCGISTVAVFGGASRDGQIKQLRNKVDIVVATPGRMIDLLESGGTHLERCTYVVLDEADRMLDMGFEPQIRQILEQVRPDRQMLMWSATWPQEVRKLAKDFFGQEKDLVHMNIGSTELQANPNIEQVIEVTENSMEKKDKVLEYLAEVPQGERVLIFTATKRTADFLEQMLYRQKFRAVAIHGGKTQAARDRALYDFRDGKRNVLVATDVASRGLDVDDIKLVINFDMPANIEDYVHRIGRTGRRGKQRKAVSIIEASETTRKLVSDLIKVLKEAKQEVPQELTDLLRTASSDSSNSRYGGKRNNFGGNNRNNNNLRRYDNQSDNFDGGYGNRGYNRNNQDQRGGYQKNYKSLMDNDENDFSSADSYERKPRFNDNRNSYSERGSPRTDNVFDDDRSERSNQRSYDRKPRRNSESNTDLYDTVLTNLNKRD